MNITYPHYLIFALIVLYFGWRLYRGRKIRKELPLLIAQGASIVDVRSAAEFSQGANPNSSNIPLNVLASRLNEIDKSKPIIVCCASGARSAMAKQLLQKNGFQNVVNAGAWTNTI